MTRGEIDGQIEQAYYAYVDVPSQREELSDLQYNARRFATITGEQLCLSAAEKLGLSNWFVMRRTCGNGEN